MSLGFYHEWRHHIRCVFTVPMGDTLRAVRVKWVLPTVQTVDMKIGKLKRTYNVDVDFAIYNQRMTPTLYYNIAHTDPLNMTRIKGRGESSNLYNSVLKDNSARQVLAEGEDKLMLIVCGVLVLIIVGIGLYSNYQLGQQNAEIASLSKHYADVIANITKANGGGIIIP